MRTKPTAAVAIEAAADQKGVELSAQPDPNPGPDWVIVTSSAADGVSPTEDMPTMSDGNPTPGEDIGYNEDIPADATPTPTPEKPQLAQERPALVYMARAYNCVSSDSEEDNVEANESYVLLLSLYNGIGCLAHSMKDKFSSSECTIYIALEPDTELRRITQHSNPLTSKHVHSAQINIRHLVRPTWQGQAASMRLHWHHGL